MKNRKGLSNVVATVLIVLLALAAIAIVWSFIQPSIEETSTTLDVSQKCLQTEVTVTYCNSTSPGEVKVQYNRGDDLTGVFAIVDDGAGGTTTGQAAVTSPSVLSTYTVAITSTAGNTAKAAAIVADENGQDHVCEPAQTSVTCADD